MALARILPQPPVVNPALAALLAQLYADRPDYGAPFAAALRRALDNVAAGIAYEPYNATHYRIQSHSQPQQWRYATLDQCSCAARTPWCWHRALLHYLTAQGALLNLAACPRPTLAHVPPRGPFDMDRVLREADELY